MVFHRYLIYFGDSGYSEYTEKKISINIEEKRTNWISKVDQAGKFCAKPNFHAPLERDTILLDINILGNGLKTEKSEESLC